MLNVVRQGLVCDLRTGSDVQWEELRADYPGLISPWSLVFRLTTPRTLVSCS
jgi:hypothetical protein